MAGARAIAQLADRVRAVRVLVLLVRPGLEVVGVATCAVRLVGGGGPVHDFGVALMAVRTRQVVTMIQWFVQQARVHVFVWQPGDSVVAGIAFLLRDEVTRIFASRGQAVVTRRTRTEYLIVIDGEHGTPGVCRVTVLAQVRREYVLCALAGRIDTVVAAEAVARDVRVVEVGGNPGHRRMTIITIVARLNMGGVLAGCDCAVVTGHAGAENLRVIHRVRRRPEDVVVAVLADVRRL